MKSLFLLTLVVFSGARAASMAYIKADGVWLEQNGKASLVAGTQGAQYAVLSPKDGTLVYFVGPTVTYSDEAPLKMSGFIRKAPYTRATALPTAMNSVEMYGYNLEWARDGSYVQAGEFRFDPRLNKVWKTSEFGPRAASKSGAVSAWIEDYKTLKVAGGKSKAARAAFDPKNLQTALKVTQKVLEVENESYKNASNWWTGDPAVSPDGQAIYFSSNGGGGGGAAGNTNYALFKLDSATDKIVALERLKSKESEGEIEGRLPGLQVSPDGKKLLIWSSFHSSAVENPSFLKVVDLPSMVTVGLVWEPKPAQNKVLDKNFYVTNWVTAACWLDKNTVALTGALVDISSFYSDNPTVDIPGPKYPNEFSLYLLDALTGKIKRTVKGVGFVSCG
jgi:hypothetical protein